MPRSVAHRCLRMEERETRVIYEFDDEVFQICIPEIECSKPGFMIRPRNRTGPAVERGTI